MTRLQAFLLAATIVNLALGLLLVAGVLHVGNTPDFYVTLPVGATCFGLYMVTRLMQKEAEVFDAEQKDHH